MGKISNGEIWAMYRFLESKDSRSGKVAFLVSIRDRRATDEETQWILSDHLSDRERWKRIWERVESEFEKFPEGNGPYGRRTYKDQGTLPRFIDVHWDGHADSVSEPVQAAPAAVLVHGGFKTKKEAHLAIKAALESGRAARSYDIQDHGLELHVITYADLSGPCRPFAADS